MQALGTSQVRFVEVGLQNRSTNDARFYAYAAYLAAHPSIRRVLLTDVSDIRLQADPFRLMDELGDRLYVGTDIDLFPDMAAMEWLDKRRRACFARAPGREADYARVARVQTVYNAGLLGGSRHLMLDMLDAVTTALDDADPAENCNMCAVNLALHTLFDSCIYTGYPLSSRFRMMQAHPKGVYVVHK